MAAWLQAAAGHRGSGLGLNPLVLGVAEFLYSGARFEGTCRGVHHVILLGVLLELAGSLAVGCLPNAAEVSAGVLEIARLGRGQVLELRWEVSMGPVAAEGVLLLLLLLGGPLLLLVLGPGQWPL